MVMAGQLSRPQAVISFMEIPKAPPPAKPITGVSGLPIFAPRMAEAVTAGAEQTRRKVFAAAFEGRIGVADGAVIANVGGSMMASAGTACMIARHA